MAAFGAELSTADGFVDGKPGWIPVRRRNRRQRRGRADSGRSRDVIEPSAVSGHSPRRKLVVLTENNMVGRTDHGMIRWEGGPDEVGK
jgi:hypothetical protein